MSANNYILIKETDKGFEVSHRDYDTDRVMGGVKKVATLKEAVIKADELKVEWFPVEYGIEIQLKESK
jgi:hypothetical protein